MKPLLDSVVEYTLIIGNTSNMFSHGCVPGAYMLVAEADEMSAYGAESEVCEEMGSRAELEALGVGGSVDSAKECEEDDDVVAEVSKNNENRITEDGLKQLLRV